jgi:PAS domain S-box-containing protein
MQVEDELLQERNTLHSILENIPDRIYLKDTEARFTKMNKAMVDSLGYESESQLIGKNEIEIFDTTSAKAIHRKDKTVIKNGKALLNDESKLVDGENKEIWFLSSKIPLKNVKEEIVGLVGISRDITKIKKAEERLKAYSEILQTAKKETDNILENVDEGLFLLNDVLLIGSQYSKALCRILNTKKLAGKSIVEFLGDKISHEDVDTVEHFLDMFFDSSYDESMIMELNPLQRIKMFFPDTGVTKTLTFNFKRIYDKKGHIQELIVIVKDITAQVKLEEKLKESEVQAKKQMEWVMSIMRVEPSMMRDFIDGMKKEFGTIEQYFKIVKKDKKFDSFTDKLYRSAHLIKGNAAILNLIFFADEMHLFEDQISIVQKKESIDLGDIKSLYGKFRVLKNSIKDIDELLSRMSQLHSQIRTTRSYENTMLVKSLQNYLKQISADLDKNVAMDVSKFDAKIIPYKYRLVVKDVVIQLIKNSVAHGIEDKDDREFYEKPEQGMITLKCAEKGDSFYLTVHDDGRGIDTDKIREKFKGKKDIDHMSDVDVAQLIYESGMSTNDKVTMISGRGVGLDAVKDKVGKYKGSISLSYKKEQFCQFDIVFPLK